jgi:hypothetical protein
MQKNHHQLVCNFLLNFSIKTILIFCDRLNILFETVVSLPPMPEMNYEPLQVVEPDDEYKHYQYLRRTSSAVKVITVIHWVSH